MSRDWDSASEADTCSSSRSSLCSRWRRISRCPIRRLIAIPARTKQDREQDGHADSRPGGAAERPITAVGQLRGVDHVQSAEAVDGRLAGDGVGDGRALSGLLKGGDLGAGAAQPEIVLLRLLEQ